MKNFINTIGLKHIEINKDTKFQEGDIITFVIANNDIELKDLSKVGLVGLISKVEDRYITIKFSMGHQSVVYQLGYLDYEDTETLGIYNSCSRKPHCFSVG